MSEFLIKQIKFSEILPIWQTQLWPNRTSIIEPVSAIKLDSTIDGEILNLIDSARFFAAFDSDKIIGVISGHLTAENQCRLRGLYVDKAYRGQSISKQLIQTQLDYAKSISCTQIWAMIRISNFGLFQKFEFEKQLETNKYEYGPHYIVQRPIRLN
ncbi:MAG: GNAT family N-acetyltransferase [Pseudobdellovibrio sp.]